MVESAGEVAEGETITTPAGIAALLAMAVVTPEQSAPTMAATFWALTSCCAAVVAAAASMQVESARVGVRVMPPGSLPAAEASFNANSAEAAISGVIDSSGPVKPRMMRMLTGSAAAAVGRAAAAAVASRRRFIFFFSLFSVFPGRGRVGHPTSDRQNHPKPQYIFAESRQAGPVNRL